MRIDLNDEIPGCIHFKWKEFLWLPQWEIYAHPEDEIALNIVNVARKMDWIREYFRRPIRVTSGYRPNKYNKLIGGARYSAHIEGKACDFAVSGLSADVVRNDLVNLLDRLKIRMEKLPGSSWTHIDLINPGRRQRYFRP